MTGGIETQIIFMLFLFVVLYLLMIRPQQRKMKAHQEMISALRRGDRVVTNGGLIGTVAKITSDHEIQLEVDEGVRVRVLRAMIAEVLSKTEPANAVVTEIVKTKDTAVSKKKPVKRKASEK